MKKLIKYLVVGCIAWLSTYLPGVLWPILISFPCMIVMLGFIFYDRLGDAEEEEDSIRYRKQKLMADFNEGMSWVYLAITLEHDPNARARLQNILKPKLMDQACSCSHTEAQHEPDAWKGYVGCKECNCDYYYPENELL